MQDQYWLYGRLFLQNNIVYLYLKGMFTHVSGIFSHKDYFYRLLNLKTVGAANRRSWVVEPFWFLPSLILVKWQNVYRYDHFCINYLFRVVLPEGQTKHFTALIFYFNLRCVSERSLYLFNTKSLLQSTCCCMITQLFWQFLTISITAYCQRSLQIYNCVVFLPHRQSTEFRCLELDVEWSLFSVLILNSGRTFFDLVFLWHV